MRSNSSNHGRLSAGAAVLALALLAGACTSGDEARGPDSSAGTSPSEPDFEGIDPTSSTPPPVFEETDSVLNVAISEPNSLDPMRISDPGAVLVARQLYEGLTSWDPALEKVRPAAAESWRASPDGRTFVFKLRQGMTFHDGSPVTARDFDYAFDRIALRSNASDVSYTLDKVVGFDEVNRSGTATHLAGISTPDDLTLVIRLSEPYQDFPAVLTHPSLVPLRKAVVERTDEFLTNPTGNGPFRIAQKWSPGSSVILRAYEGFVQTPELDGIRFLAYDDAAASWVDFVRGDVDVAEVPPGQFEDAAKRFGEENFKPFLKSEYLGLNVNSGALGDVDLRKAINFAVDRNEIATTVFKGTLQPARGIVPAGLPGFQENICVDLCSYSPERARASLRKVPKKDRKVDIVYTKGEPTEKMAKLAARDLEDVGIRVTTKAYDFPPYLKLLQDEKQEAYRLGWIGEYPSPDVFLTPLFGSASTDNHSGFASPAADRLLAAAHRTPSPGKRQSLYIEAEKEIMKSYPIVPIGSFITHWAVHPGVTDIQFDVMGGFDATEVFLEDE